MSFEPLAYVWGTITHWHVMIWVALATIPTIVLPLATKQKIAPDAFAVFLWMFASMYGIFGLIAGQLFGDKFAYLEVLPTGFIFGAAFTLTPLLTSIFRKEARNGSTFGCVILSIPLGGLFFGSCTWLFPRVIGFGLIDFPKYSWGVQL